MDHLCGSHTIQTVTNQLCHSLTASNASFLSHPIGPDVRISPLLQLPGGTCTTLRYRSNPTHSALPSPFSLLPIKLCMDLYIPFQWSGTLASSQLVLCEILVFVLKSILSSINIATQFTFSSIYMEYLFSTFHFQSI